AGLLGVDHLERADGERGSGQAGQQAEGASGGLEHGGPPDAGIGPRHFLPGPRRGNVRRAERPVAWGFFHDPGQEQPAAKAFRKHPKSETVRTGAVVEPSQLAYVSPAAKAFKKQPKSDTVRTGGAVEPSQLA